MSAQLTKMKKTITLIIGLLCTSIITWARTPQEAAQIASQFITQSNATPTLRLQKAAAATSVTAPVELAFTQYQIDNTTPAVFVFNRTDEGLDRKSVV